MKNLRFSPPLSQIPSLSWGQEGARGRGIRIAQIRVKQLVTVEPMPFNREEFVEFVNGD